MRFIFFVCGHMLLACPVVQAKPAADKHAPGAARVIAPYPQADPGGVSTDDPVFALVLGRIAEDLQSAESDIQLNNAAGKALKTLTARGDWPDVRYDNPEFEHLARIKLLAAAFSRKGSAYYGDQTVYAAITGALQYWLDKNPHNRNWWFNDISYPQQLGQILILMRTAPSPLPKAMEGQAILRMTRKLKPNDFANTSDEALHYLYRACLTSDQTLLDSAVHYLYEPVQLRPDGQGLQVDNSYFQHGRQQAIASYGAVFIANSYNAAWYFKDTRYAMPKEQLKLLSDFFSYTYLRSIRKGYADFNTKGRGISRTNGLRLETGALQYKAMLTDPMMPTPPASLNTVCWISDYTLQSRPDYSISVQLSSTRTLRTERGNNENLLGRFLPDGATDIRRRGDEYYNIPPVWKWDKLPGVTNREYDKDTGCTILKEWGIPGTTDFSGGISDSLYGAAAYIQDFDSVRAHKSWFFFDQEMVCLGSGITSSAAEHITTTVNQCWQNGTVRMINNRGGSDKLKDETATGSWPGVWQDSVGYFFPGAPGSAAVASSLNSGALHIRAGKQSGSWYRINRSGAKDAVSGNVFSLWIDHGAMPVDGCYAYIVIPDLGSPAAMSAYDTTAIHILSNTPDIQAVEKLDVLEATFFKPGILKAGALSITVDQPCMLLIRQAHGQHPVVAIADPTQQAETIQLSLQLPGLGASHSMKVNMPHQPYAGSTIKLSLEK